MGSASVWKFTRAHTSNRSEQLSRNSKPRCFENLKPKTDKHELNRPNGINGIIPTQFSDDRRLALALRVELSALVGQPT